MTVKRDTIQIAPDEIVKQAIATAKKEKDLLY